jgi:hypothetical protein
MCGLITTYRFSERVDVYKLSVMNRLIVFLRLCIMYPKFFFRNTIFILVVFSMFCMAATYNRQGGDTIEDAHVITSLPFIDNGTTVGWGDDYDETCPYPGNSSPDVVYSYTPDADMVIEVSLCNAGTFYDTKMFIYENEASYDHLLGCNDDACSGPDFPYPYLSRLYPVYLTAGYTYYIVICGYNGESGIYALTVGEIHTCEVECPPDAVMEGEPDCYDGYDDQYNSGCGGVSPVFTPLVCGMTLCGTSGTFLFENSQTRDSDWYQFEVLEATPVTISIFSEFPATILLINAASGNCSDYEILDFASAEICVETTLQRSLPAGLYWVWVAPVEFTGVDCGAEYLLSLEQDMQPIQDLVIECTTDQLLLQWTEVPDASLYHIYASQEPCHDFEWVDSTEDPLWGTTIGRNRQFFRVTYEVE